jgi:hypothetical protein
LIKDIPEFDPLRLVSGVKACPIAKREPPHISPTGRTDNKVQVRAVEARARTFQRLKKSARHYAKLARIQRLSPRVQYEKPRQSEMPHHYLTHI